MGRCHEIEAGSITVFFALFFPLFMCFFAALYSVADYHITKTLSAQVVRNGCQSALGEFDRKLEEKYGIYAVKGNAQCAFAAQFYVEENLTGRGILGLPAAVLTDFSVVPRRDLSSLTEVREQISSFMTYRRYAAWADEILDAVGVLNDGLASDLNESGDTAGGGTSETDLKDIFPKNEFEWRKYVDNANKLAAAGIQIRDLPSFSSHLLQEELEETDEDELSELLLEKLKNIGRELLNKADLVLYCAGMFSDFSDSVAAQQGRSRALSLREKEKLTGFFQNEVEYLLWGFGNETGNIRATKYELVALRILFNMAAFSADPIMMERLVQLATDVGEALGIEGSAVALKVLLVAWCWAEAEQDYRHLAVGDRVPLFKTDLQWEVGTDCYIQPERGWDYNDHLKLLLALVPSGELLARVSDLIYLENDGKVALNEYICAFTVRGKFEKGWLSFSFKEESAYR